MWILLLPRVDLLISQKETRRYSQNVAEFLADKKFISIFGIHDNGACSRMNVELLCNAANVKRKFVIIAFEETDWERRSIEREEHFVALAVSERMSIAGIEMKSGLRSKRDIVVKELRSDLFPVNTYIRLSILQAFLLTTLFVLAFFFLADNVDAADRAVALFRRTFDAFLFVTTTSESVVVIRVWDGADKAGNGSESNESFVKHSCYLEGGEFDGRNERDHPPFIDFLVLLTLLCSREQVKTQSTPWPIGQAQTR